MAIFQASFIGGVLEWMQACLASLVLVGDTGQPWGWVLLLEETLGCPVKLVFHQKMKMKPSRK